MNFANILSYLPMIIQIGRLIPQIKSAYDAAPNNTMAKVQAVIQNTNVVPMLEAVGAQLFPKLAPNLHAAAAAVITAHPDATSWLQEALNVVNAAGLKVDGHYGPLTRQAVEDFQAKHGLPVTGFASDVENAAIQFALSKL